MGLAGKKGRTRGPEICQSLHSSIHGAGLWTAQGTWVFEPCLLTAAL